MIKIIYCVRKRDDIEAVEFYRYWLENHGPLCKSLAADIGACRYVQSHTIMPEMNADMAKRSGMEQPYDGVTEVWWQSQEDFDRATSSAQAQEAWARLAEDESHFIDISGSRVFMTEEHEIF